MNVRPTLTFVAVLAAGGLGFGLRSVLAEGIPDTNPLYYSGTLTESGSLVNGTRAITINLWPDATSMGTPLCQTVVSAANVVNGRFRIAMASACKTALNANNNAYVEVVDGATTLGRSKIGAVPYAVEADHALNATHATTADNATYADDAGHAASADTAANASHAGSADNATNATNAGSATSAAVAKGITANLSSGLSGTPPAGTPLVWQAGTNVGTSDSNGHLPISFPSPFPNGLVTVVITNSFAQGASVSGILDNETVSGFTVVMGASQLVRINWVALGW